jgi:hypothetical protein
MFLEPFLRLTDFLEAGAPLCSPCEEEDFLRPASAVFNFLYCSAVAFCCPIHYLCNLADLLITIKLLVVLPY